MTVIGSKRKASEEQLEPKPIDGVPPPNDIEAEAAVLSAIMLSDTNARAGIAEVADLLHPEAFYSEAHRQIFQAALEVDRKGQPIDVMTVAAQLKDDQRLGQIGGTAYLASILDSAPVVQNVRAYAEIVDRHWRSRRMIFACQRFAARGYSERDDPARFAAELETEIQRINGATTGDRATHARPLLRRVYDTISNRYQDGRPPGIATGYRSYDDLCVGLHRKELTLIAARPGMGKTSLLVSLGINVAGTEPMLLSDDGTPWQEQGVAIFSLEMPDEQIGSRMIAVESMVSAHRLRTGRVSEDDWSPITHACHRLANMPIEVDDTSAITVPALRSKVRRSKARMKTYGARLTVVIIDYLQLMRGAAKHRGRDEEIGEISRGLKELAKEEDVAVVAGCQLNRALETRNGPEKRPRISDLRESGNLEQDADNIVFIYRGEVYGEKPPEGEEGRTELIIAKQRNGPTGTAIVRYVPGCTRFEPMHGY